MKDHKLEQGSWLETNNNKWFVTIHVVRAGFVSSLFLRDCSSKILRP